MAKLAMRFEIILPKEKNYPQSRYDKWDQMTTVYFNTVLRLTLLDAFGETVKGWEHKPSFKATYSTPYTIRKQLVVEPVGRYTLNWSRISEGTANRSIFPRMPGGYMTFQRDYTPHTRAGGKAFWGGPGSDSGPAVHPREVINHSIEPRHFTKEIAKDKEEQILNELRAIAMKVFK